MRDPHTIEHRWNIQATDCKVCVVMTIRPGINIYTSLEVRTESAWQHIPGSALGHGLNESAALARVESLSRGGWRDKEYEQWVASR